MRSTAAATARQIHQPSPGRGHTDASTRRLKAVKTTDDEEVIPKDVRKRGEKRVLFYNLSEEALTALREKAQGTRYEKAPDIEYQPSGGVTVKGPLRTIDYFEHLCALARKDPAITFSALGQKGRDDFYPLRCGGNDDQLIVAVSEATGK